MFFFQVMTLFLLGDFDQFHGANAVLPVFQVLSGFIPKLPQKKITGENMTKEFCHRLTSFFYLTA